MSVINDQEVLALLERFGMLEEDGKSSPGLRIETIRGHIDHTAIYAAMERAFDDDVKITGDWPPAVFWQKEKETTAWVAILNAEDFLNLFKIFFRVAKEEMEKST